MSLYADLALGCHEDVSNGEYQVRFSVATGNAGL